MKTTSTFRKGGAKSTFEKVEQNLIHLSLRSRKVQRDFREA